MKSSLQVVCWVACLVGIAALMQSCGGSKPTISPLIITTSTLPNGTVETAYSQQLQATGGVGPYTWSVSTGTPPNEIQLGNNTTATDTISGTPDTPIQSDAFSIKVTDSASQFATRNFTVSITGLADTLAVSPATLVFDPQQNGTASTTQTATLSNSGTSAVAINSIVSSGANSTDFGEKNNCGSSLASGASCEIDVTFIPGQAGPRVASITINDDTNGTPHQLGLNGTGLSPGPNATLSATSMTFAGQELNTTSPSQTITLTNYGMTAVSVAGVAVTGNFAQTNTCPPTLASAASCPINVSFTPIASGTATGTLSVNDDLSGSPQTVTLNGTGAASGTPVLTGDCAGATVAGNECGGATDLTDCPAGAAAIGPTNMLCGNGGYVNIDNSRGCIVHGGRVDIPDGRCATAPAAAASRIASRKSCNKPALN